MYLITPRCAYWIASQCTLNQFNRSPACCTPSWSLTDVLYTELITHRRAVHRVDHSPACCTPSWSLTGVLYTELITHRRAVHRVDHSPACGTPCWPLAHWNKFVFHPSIYSCSDGTNRVACTAGTANGNTGRSAASDCGSCTGVDYSTGDAATACQVTPQDHAWTGQPSAIESPYNRS